MLLELDLLFFHSGTGAQLTSGEYLHLAALTAGSASASTPSYAAGAQPLPINVPRRPTGAGLPLFYRVNIAQTGNALAETISTGSIIGGIVLARADSPDTLGLYPS